MGTYVWFNMFIKVTRDNIITKCRYIWRKENYRKS